MKLTYRGGTYEVPAPVQLSSNSKEQSKIKLIYRGHTYNTTSCSVMVPEVVKANGSMVTLIYRGNPYRRKLQSLNSGQKPHVINCTRILVES